ncbi:MAG: hypothetical protein U5P10_01315 [Spirochaetia bacterium]|nr:hypothetical protein [Spirochaetia bacterium]
MSKALDHMVEVITYSEIGYKPVVDYNGWRVAVLNYHYELLPENITHFQKHNETIEVFLLVQGSCVLYIGEGKETITDIHGIQLQPGAVYSVKRGVWHSHTLSPDARVMIVENTDTGEHNSPLCRLTAENREKLRQIAADFAIS